MSESAAAYHISDEHPRIWQAIAGQPWAIQPDALEQIIAIADRAGSLEALQAVRADPLRTTRTASVREGVAIVPITGPLFPRANLFAQVSGATSTETLAQDLTKLLDDSTVQSIVLDIDSPGGQVGGISELADLIFQARGRVPIVAYINGMGSSGAYWIASAADEIIVADTALLGSIGVVMAANVKKDPNRVEIVSSRAPLKRADLASDEGRAAVQTLVNKLEDVFIAAVARNRGFEMDAVVTGFGQGGLMVGADAVVAGMADRVSTFENVIAGLSGRQPTRGLSMTTKAQAGSEQPAITLDLIKSEYTDIAAALRAEGEAAAKTAAAAACADAATAERERIQAVYAQGQKLPGHGKLIQTLMFDGKTTGPEAAVEILAAESTQRGKTLADINADAPRPAPSSDGADIKGGIDPNAPIEERAKAEWDQDSDTRAEFRGNFDGFLAFKRAEDSGRVKILKRA